MRFGKDPEVGAAHIHFDALRHDEQRLEDVFLSLAEQLMQPSFASSSGMGMANLPSDHSPYLLCRVLELLRETVERHQQVFIVVDALDECLESQRSRFLGEMLRLQAHYGVKLMVTSGHL